MGASPSKPSKKQTKSSSSSSSSETVVGVSTTDNLVFLSFLEKIKGHFPSLNHVFKNPVGKVDFGGDIEKYLLKLSDSIDGKTYGVDFDKDYAYLWGMYNHRRGVVTLEAIRNRSIDRLENHIYSMNPTLYNLISYSQFLQPQNDLTDETYKKLLKEGVNKEIK
jgi:hypothetical protein